MSLMKNGHPLQTINHHQLLTKYSNSLTDQPLSKHYRVKLDLDGPRKTRYPRITKRATKRVSVLSLCCDQRQETFVNLGLFQTTTNLGSFLSLCLSLLWLFRAFYSLSFSFYLYQVRSRHCETREIRSYLQLNIN